jgi:cytochrome c553
VTTRRAACLLASAALLATTAPAADVAAGRTKANGCAVCHGPLGLSAVPDAPNLAGQPAIYLSAQLKAFRSGARVHEVMNLIAKPLNDAEISDLAAWYASLKLQVQPP